MVQDFKLASRDYKKEDTIIQVGDVEIGGNDFVMIAGPCAVESEAQLMTTAYEVKNSGANILRGGAYKPRTSPHSFQGLGEEGLILLAKTREEINIPIITEVMDTRDVKLVEKYADILQIGTRNMQNFSLLKEVGCTQKPVLLKRGMMATIYDFLLSAEYILNEGNENVILCERGIRTFESLTRNTLDLSAIPIIKKLSHLPIIVDPSHSTGRRDLVKPMTKAAIAAGAHGAMIEVHIERDKALCDGNQSLTPQDFLNLMQEIQPLIKFIKTQQSLQII